jgi:thiaminase
MILDHIDIFRNPSADSILSIVGISLGTNLKNVFSSTTTTMNYTSYLRQIVLTASVSEIVSAIDPCPWAYFETAVNCQKNTFKERFTKMDIIHSSEESYKQVKEIKIK